MRQLKGKVNETRREKRERKQDNLRVKDQFLFIALPVLLVISGLIVAYVYVNTRPKNKI